MSASPTEPAAPQAETTGAAPGLTGPSRRPAAGPAIPLSTQEVRLAAVLTGGVSLAIWMGGVVGELNRLVQASNRRLAGAGPDTDPVRGRYQQLLECLDVAVSVDVLSGTSAGGINAALLGLVNATGQDLAPLRDIWLAAGAFDKLLRDPAEPDPPSLLRGDGQLLSALRSGISQLLAMPAAGVPGRTDVFITTTLLSPETSRFVDDYGTLIEDADHHGLFHFTETDLQGTDILGPLALAARSSASFPAAFEPAYLPYGTSPDGSHPDMAGYANTSRAHWAADGGLLANRPIGPLLQTVFDRPASREVRRGLLYIVPSSSAGPAGDPELISAPFGMADALRHDLGAALNQSIAADLSAITEHNERVAAIADTRLRMAELGARLLAAGSDGAAGLLCDASTWADYRWRQGRWLVDPLLDEVCRQLANLATVPQAWRAELAAPDYSFRLAASTRAATVAGWPESSPLPAAAAIAAGSLGRAALDSAKAAVLDLLRSGYALADLGPVRMELAALADELHQAFRAGRRLDLRGFVRTGLAAPDAQGQPLGSAVRRLCAEYLSSQGQPDQLEAAWTGYADIINRAHPLLAALVDTTAPPASPVVSEQGESRRQRQARAARRVTGYLAYYGDDPELIALRLLELHVAERSVLPVGLDVEQPVELIQISADTRTLLAGNRSTAETKLTGMQLHHFGAFYKASWRANDWMWGRLDGCGWLVHVLLDPRRLRAVMENNQVPAGQRARLLMDQLAAIAGQPSELELIRLTGTLHFLDDDGAPVPVSLPELSLWVAAALQRFIAQDELACLASYLVPDPADGALTGRQRQWLDRYQQAVRIAEEDQRRAAVAALLADCPVPDEKLTDTSELDSPLFVRTVTQTVAVAAAITASIQQLPSPLRPALGAVRTLSRIAYIGVDRTHGKRRSTALVGVALMAVGLLAMINHSLWLGLPGLVLFGAGAMMVSVTVLRRLAAVLSALAAIALLLIAAAPWLPWLNDRLFSWLTRTVLPWMQQQKWPWTVLFLFVLIPAGSSVLARLRRR